MLSKKRVPNAQLSENRQRSLLYSVRLSGTIVDKVAKRLGISIPQAVNMYAIICEEIKEELILGRAVGLPGVGCLHVYIYNRTTQLPINVGGSRYMRQETKVTRVKPVKMKLDAQTHCDIHNSAKDHGPINEQAKKEYIKFTSAHFKREIL